MSVRRKAKQSKIEQCEYSAIVCKKLRRSSEIRRREIKTEIISDTTGGVPGRGTGPKYWKLGENGCQ